MRTVAVVGAGFSGLLTALNLIAASPDVQVRLIERRSAFGRGRAYATANPDHLLNVRTANMSAYADRPDHFQAWLAGRSDFAAADSRGFVSRGLYGEYLQNQLRTAMAEDGKPGRLLLEADEAVGARPMPGGTWAVRLGMGRMLEADALVLAPGLLPPHAAPGAEPGLAESPAYFADPWAFDPAEAAEGDVLLIGAGLTMVDVALGLEGSGRRITAVSRRGLMPREHASVTAAAPPKGRFDTPVSALRTMRAYARTVGWRAAVDSIRPRTQSIWRSWSLDQRRAFLRHARPWWEGHRHRMAPPIASRLSRMLQTGELTVQAGRISRLEPNAAGGIDVRYAKRDSEVVTRAFATVVNCTGPHGDLDAAREPLLVDLRAQGLIRADPLRLGLDVDARLRLIGSGGRARSDLFAVGPLTRGAFWESVAVPDLRVQAAAAVRELLDSLGLDLAADIRVWN